MGGGPEWLCALDPPFRLPSLPSHAIPLRNMCGRFALNVSAEDLSRLFGIAPQVLPDLGPRFNIAPTQPVLAVRQPAAGPREADLLRWGLLPAWAKDLAMGARMINARAESAADKPAFRSALRHRRCIVPASGFYEWRAERDGKQPYFIHDPQDAVLAIAGLWERWRAPDGLALETCALLTTAANPDVVALHDRMPVLLRPADFERWLDPRLSDPLLLTDLLQPAPSGSLLWHAVGRRVNRAGEEGPDLVRSLPAAVG